MKVVDVGGVLYATSAACASPEPIAPAGPDFITASSAQQSSGSSGTRPAPKRAYPAPAELPTQQGPKGIRFDFNDGCRVVLPASEHPWRVRLSDLDTGNILFETTMNGGRVNSSKRYFVRIRLEIWSNGDSVLGHDYSAAGRDVLVQLPAGTLGDPMGWFPYAVKFKDLHRCRLTCLLSGKLLPLFREAYPDITFVTQDEEVNVNPFYATYSLGLFFDDTGFVHQPCDFRHVGLHRTAGYILGVDPAEVAPRIRLEDETRPIAEPYVCIAVQSTTQSKYWNNPNGWREIVRFLKDAGYRVICIDQKPTHGMDYLEPHPKRGRGRNRRPASARTGPLAQACRLLHRAFERPILARLGRRHAGGHDLGFYAPNQRVRHALQGDQLSCLQFVLERCAPPLRPQGFHVLPAPQGHATPIRMYAADHGGAGEGGCKAYSGVRRACEGAGGQAQSKTLTGLSS